MLRLASRLLTLTVLASAMLFLLGGCSVAMALGGKKEPDLAAVRVGCSRGEVEQVLGKSKQVASLENGQRMEVYNYETNHEPNPPRAITHGALDVFTLGIWEVVGTPIELNIGDKQSLCVVYGPDDRVVSLNSGPRHPYMPPPPSTDQATSVPPPSPAPAPPSVCPPPAAPPTQPPPSRSPMTFD
jgi:hypothetical protein